ncbi:MAG: glycoside hydrolase [Sulfurovum sp.]|nr:MAG: glycoside hydrolase [Sulfurovum sp.]
MGIDIKTIVIGLLLMGILFMISRSKLPHGDAKNRVIRVHSKMPSSITKKNKTIQNSLIDLATSKIGSPYVYAKTGPDSFDCSGFVYYLFSQHNITIPRTSLAQSKIGKKLTREALQKGDILFFDTSGKGHINHSGVYIGEDRFIHASSGKAKSVTISSLNAWYKDKFRWGIRKMP